MIVNCHTVIRHRGSFQNLEGQHSPSLASLLSFLYSLSIPFLLVTLPFIPLLGLSGGSQSTPRTPQSHLERRPPGQGRRTTEMRELDTGNGDKKRNEGRERERDKGRVNLLSDA